MKRSHEYTDERVERANPAITKAVSWLAARAQIVVLPMHPTLAVAYEPRMSDHMDRMGFGDAVFDWRELQAEHLEGALQRLWSRRDVIGKEMQEAARTFRALAWKNAEILAPYL